VLAVWTVLLADLPAAGEHRSVGFSIYIYALVLQFGSLSTIAAYRLWAAGRDQPSVARNRMRRRLYEAIRQLEERITEPYDIVITVFSDAVLEAAHPELAGQLKKQLKELSVIKPK